MRQLFSQKLKFISSLKLHFSEYGYSSLTYDFDYVCVADSRIVPGGRLAYSLLSPFAQAKEVVTYPYGYEGQRQMSDALSVL